jgi:mannose-1-phosphate guanylyltransferase / mannose-6-phosphate isomerase
LTLKYVVGFIKDTYLMPSKRRAVALLLSGGAGTRLWPSSRADCPKQFLRIFGELSLYQLTLKRLRAAGVDEVIVAANRDHKDLLTKQATEIGEAAPTLILEPARRDSGPAIAAGVAYARQKFGDEAIICAMPCDHLIPDLPRFKATLHSAMALAGAGYLTTFGILPTMPSNQFGYLQQGEAVSAVEGAYRVSKFHEKPRTELAVQYLASGDYCWNSGMFVFSTGVFAHEASIHMPATWAGADAAAKGSKIGGNVVTLDEAPFLAIKPISIDYALFELSQNVAMVRADFAWSDVGSWSAVFEALDKDTDGNAIQGDAKLRDCKETLVVGENIRVVAIGVSDLVIVARPDGVLVSRRERSAEVKDLLS